MTTLKKTIQNLKTSKKALENGITKELNKADKLINIT